jgi:hypothetical protein
MKGESKVAIVTGAEALASRKNFPHLSIRKLVTDVSKVTACAAAKKLPPPGWTAPSEDVTAVFSPTTRELAPSPSRLSLLSPT